MALTREYIKTLQEEADETYGKGCVSINKQGRAVPQDAAYKEYADQFNAVYPPSTRSGIKIPPPTPTAQKRRPAFSYRRSGGGGFHHTC